MMYILIFIFITTYLYFSERIRSSSFLAQLTIWLPAFLVFFIPMAIQDSVGTDYKAYKSMYYDNDFSLYLIKGEFFLIKVIELAKILGDPQFIFVIFSFLISLSFFYSLFLLRNLGFSPWLIFLLYFLVTGLYQTSFNVLRQSLVFSFLILLIYWVVKRENFKFFVSLFLLGFIHKTAYLYLVLFVFFKKIPSKKYIFYIFLGSMFFYALFNQKLLISYILNVPLISSLTGNYTYYIDTDFFDAGKISSILPKLYYTPLFFCFWFFYLRSKKVDVFFDFLIFIWSLTYFMFFQMLYIEIYFRLWNMFSFLCIFPIYYIFQVLYRKNIWLLGILVLYLFVPFFIKVFIFPSAEYKYNYIQYLF
ncbi:EpsG family protein [Acinetobacter sp. YH12039]|uniref:EpsG family protein n=1 Tax=Acinetobacter sp. YH12039 TaxID=2601047 RepID=UPI0015D34AB0|nr:EpsG family protein [Acinetobacter sp. YH12039]